MFTSTWGDDPIWRAYCSDGLRTPSRLVKVLLGLYSFIKKVHNVPWISRIVLSWTWILKFLRILSVEEVDNCGSCFLCSHVATYNLPSHFLICWTPFFKLSSLFFLQGQLLNLTMTGFINRLMYRLKSCSVFFFWSAFILYIYMLFETPGIGGSSDLIPSTISASYCWWKLG